MAVYNISLNDELAEIVDMQIKIQKYSTKSEFFRDLIRHKYVKDMEDFEIERIDGRDPDYDLVQNRKKNAKFIPISNLLN
jgi:Arc/MetJ-type ribon-helix-helix transcriptional regulator